MSSALPDPEAEPLRSPRTAPDADVPVHRSDQGSDTGASRRPSEIEVTVLGPSGQAVELAEVSLLPLPGAENDTLLLLGYGSFVEGWTLLTGKGGECSFDLPGAFEGVLSARWQGMEPSTKCMVRSGDGIVLALQPRVASPVGSKERNEGADIAPSPVFDAENALAPRAWVEGVLIDHAGRPLRNALIVQLTEGRDGALPGSLTLFAARSLPHVRTDDRGRFMLPLASANQEGAAAPASVHLAALAWPYPVAIRSLSSEEYVSPEAPTLNWGLEEGFTVNLRGAPAQRSVLVEELEFIEASRLVVRRRMVRSEANGKLSIPRVRQGTLRVSIPGVETTEIQVGDLLG